jgi:hypothetical protein
MDWISRTDLLLLAIAAYVAVMTLVRMMQRRREQVVADVQRQLAAHRKRTRRSEGDRNRDAA